MILMVFIILIGLSMILFGFFSAIVRHGTKTANIIPKVTKEKLDELICSDCGAATELGDLFCPKCGVKFEKEIICKSCGTQIKNGILFCTKCGLKVSD